LVKDALPVFRGVKVTIGAQKLHQLDFNLDFVAVEDSYFSNVPFLLLQLQAILPAEEHTEILENVERKWLRDLND
jgi:hypothetical protein